MDALADDRVGLPAVQGRESLRRQIAHALRAALITGKMRPGVVYSAPALAEEFGVSPTPVREAMIDLVKDGLVEAVRNRGFRVVPLSTRELDELTEMRELVELPAVVKLAGRIGEEAAGRLGTIAAEIVERAESGDLIGYIDADRRFHTELLSITGNRVLIRTVLGLRNRSRLYGLAALSERSELTASAAEHGELLDALIARDTAQVEALMRRHLEHIRRDWA